MSGDPSSLFAKAEQANLCRVQPLSARMRPRSLADFVGQRHFLGEGKLLRRLIDADRLSSVIFFGPPGTGKTTLAQILANETNCRFGQISAVESGVKELRRILETARDKVLSVGWRTMLFVDEIHRFTKSQQDVLLHDVEDGIIILVGATTSNPFFAVNSALVSRSQVFQFEPLADADILQLLQRALSDEKRGLGEFVVEVEDGALQSLASRCDGDARRALNALEIAIRSATESPVRLSVEAVAESIQRKSLAFDRDGDTHYDLASALIKSMRGSDPDAAIYWLARLLESGEDIRFITRRLVILASEDIGNADPAALTLAVSTMQACEFVGLPECQLTLAQAVIYLACAPKSNAATSAIGSARQDVQEGSVIPVPRHLRDGHYAGARRLGHGQDYVYSHDEPDGIAAQDYLGVHREYYRPTDRGQERELVQRLESIRRRLRGEPDPASS
jgi:putative ATPase